MSLPDTFYNAGSAHACLQLGLQKTAARQLTDPKQDAMFYGDESIPMVARQWDLQRELGKIEATVLPEKQKYQQEAGRAGAFGGGVLGGLAGGAVGSSGGLKGMALGGALGVAGGAGLGYLGGRSVGGSDYDADVNLHQNSSSLMQDPQSQQALLHRLKQERDDALTTRQQAHERGLADMSRERINHNFDHTGS